MEPQDDPEKRIRELESPLADSARASEMGSAPFSGQAYPPPPGSYPPPGPYPPPWPGAAGVRLRWPVSRAAAQARRGQPRVVDRGDGHRRRRDSSRGRHRRLRRAPAFRCPVDDLVSPDRLPSHESALEYPGRAAAVGRSLPPRHPAVRSASPASTPIEPSPATTALSASAGSPTRSWSPAIARASPCPACKTPSPSTRPTPSRRPASTTRSSTTRARPRSPMAATRTSSRRAD